MSLTHRFLKATRTTHLYLGVFTAPMLMFFAITGGLQSFSLHEATRGGSYVPPAWLASAAQFHKKQTTVLPQRRPRPAVADEKATLAPTPAGATTKNRSASTSVADNAAARPKKNLLPMKAFFVLVALGLLVSVLSGLYMAWRYSRKPLLFGTVLAAGIMVPLLLLLF
ncbi:PepSY domain-containing protein [Rhodanobacter sp. Col0626]|uniref:PepSY domain-containing protein n=1 Tax=Rhodanobacter sp. Col0626 TaxID=3415679 RepID=UPI003CF04F8B